MWHGYAVTSSTLLADPPSNETIDVFYINTANKRYTMSPLLRPFAVHWVILAECLVTPNGAMYTAEVTSNLPHFSFCPVRAAVPSVQTPTRSDQRVSCEVTAAVSHSLEHIISST